MNASRDRAVTLGFIRTVVGHVIEELVTDVLFCVQG